MNKLPYIILILLCCAGPAGSFARQIPGDNPVLLSGELYMPVSNYSGQSWYFSNWREGSVTTINGEVFKGLMLMYNMLLDELFWQTPATMQYVMLDKGQIRSFSFEGDNNERVAFEHILLKDPQAEIASGKYARILYRDENATLFALTHKRLSSRSERINRGGQVVHVRILSDSRRYYLQLSDNKMDMLTVGLRHRAFLNAMSDKAAVRAFLRNQQIRIRDEQSLVQAVSLLSRAGLLQAAR